MTTADTVISRVRTQLLSGSREQVNRLAAAYTAGGTSLTFEFDLEGIQAGAVLSVGLNRFYVWSVNTTSKTATVTGGWEGTTDADAASGDLVRVSPKFPDDMLLDRVNDELRDLSSPLHGLFQMKTVDLTYNAAVEGYDLTGVTDVIEIWRVRHQVAGSEKDWPESKHWEWSPSMPTGTFASGKAIWLQQGEPGQSVRVWYKAPFSTIDTLGADVETNGGLPATAIDLLELGVLLRVTAVRDIGRNFIDSQPEPRRAGEVPPGANMDTASGLRALRRERIAAERARLNALYPVRRR